MPQTIAYIVSRFPKLTETFILYEMTALEKLGLRIELFPLVKQQAEIRHPQADAFGERAFSRQPWSPAVWASQLYWLIRRPKVFLAMWRNVLWGNRRSFKFLTRSVIAGLLGGWFARQMKPQGVDHIHAHWATHAALSAYVVHKLTDIPFSFTAHAHDIYVERAMLAEKIQAAAFVVTISQYNRRFLQELYGNELAAKVHVIHCGVDTAVFQPRNAQSANSPFTIICVGRLEEKKGQRYLIEACARLAVANISFRCLLVGDGPERPLLTAQITKHKLDEPIKLLGQQTRNQVSALLTMADLMVLPSVELANGKKEGIPVALMEALAVELPVVASDLSGIGELVENGRTGLLVPERNPAALAAAIQQVMNNPAWGHQLGVNGRNRVVEQFDLYQNTSQLADLFRQVAQEPQKVTSVLDWQPEEAR